MSLGLLNVLLGEVSVQVFCGFFNWVGWLSRVKWCEFFIYFGDQILVRGIIGKYVFPYVWLSFHLMLFSLAMQKLFILMISHLFILSFMFFALWDISVKILLHEVSEIFLPTFSFRTFMVLQLIFKSFIHLEFFCVCGVSWWLSFMFLHVAV